MSYPAPADQEAIAIIPHRKIETVRLRSEETTGDDRVRHILHLPGGQRIIMVSGSIQVWDLEQGTQVGEEWEDKDVRVRAIALAPGGKTVATGCEDGAVKLWDVDTGKVIKTCMGHTQEVKSVCWSPDGRRVVSRSFKEIRVWDVESGETIVGPIDAGVNVSAVCYSPDGKMITAGGVNLKIWDANSGKLLKTLEGFFTCLAWTSNGKILIAGPKITKFDTATWTVLQVDVRKNVVDTISISPNERILASTTHLDKTVRLWNLETNEPIVTQLHHEDLVNCATFSADGKLLVTGCDNGHIYIWDVSAMIEDGLPSDIADAIRLAPKIKDARQIPQGFFDDFKSNSRTHPSQSHGQHDRPTPAPRQRIFSHFSSFWRRSKSHMETEREAQPRSHSLSWARNVVSSMLRRRDESDTVEVPYTAAQPRSYHARKKPAPGPSHPPNAHTMQQQTSAATQSTPSSSQTSPPTATSTLSAVTAAPGIAGTISRPDVTIRQAGWGIRFMLWATCASAEYTVNQP
ncbi:WD40 repeat-like protein [Suillus hirtellus]|nr:WD40 repeat-like protein [Suillus hirtellus]